MHEKFTFGGSTLIPDRNRVNIRQLIMYPAQHPINKKDSPVNLSSRSDNPNAVTQLKIKITEITYSGVSFLTNS